ncbi:MAG: sigma-70 family RNA polymerase sigma factor [Verrucomicrobia bacterium]|nr:sigma-70 family RNA polymerase sigma factor [Verrucomicrobiota bacterium]
MILDAANRQSPDAKQALEQLCATYWPPLYAFIRRRGRSPADAKDLTQGFFAELLSRDGLQTVHPAKGRFRTFLLTCLENFLSNERDKSQAQKRGGNAAFISIDEALAEERYRLLPATVADPAQLLDRAWANVVIEQVLQQLKAQCAAAGKATVFDVLHNFITGDAVRGDYAAAAARLQMTEATARKAAHDLRADFRRLLFREIGRTVDNVAGIEDEIRQLFALFAR